MTQAELAEKLMVSDKTVSKWETGRGYPDISLLEPIANVFEISIVSPSGEVVDRIFSKSQKTTNIKFVYEETEMEVKYFVYNYTNGDELILVKARNLKEGIWKFKLYGKLVVNGQYYAWFWFGMVLTLFLVGILIEIIYHLDRKRIFDHKIWTLGSSACVLGISLIFALDLMGYDQWIPQRDSVTNMTMQFRYSYWNFGDELGGVDNSSQYLEQHIEELQGDCVYALAQEGISNLNRELEEDCSWATVVYKMKNGSIKKREYRIATDTLIEAEKQLYEETLYKTANGKFPVAANIMQKSAPTSIRTMMVHRPLKCCAPYIPSSFLRRLFPIFCNQFYIFEINLTGDSVFFAKFFNIGLIPICRFAPQAMIYMNHNQLKWYLFLKL